MGRGGGDRDTQTEITLCTGSVVHMIMLILHNNDIHVQYMYNVHVHVPVNGMKGRSRFFRASCNSQITEFHNPKIKR